MNSKQSIGGATNPKTLSDGTL